MTLRRYVALELAEDGDELAIGEARRPAADHLALVVMLEHRPRG